MIKRIKKSGPVNGLLLFIAIICFISVVYTTLTYGRCIINSDIALVSRFYDAVVRTGSIYPKSWNAVNGEIYAFTRLPVNVLMLSIIKNRALAIVISNCIMYSIALAGIIWISRTFFKNNCWLVLVPLYGAFLCGYEARMMIFLHGEYCQLMIAFTFCFGLFWKNILSEKPSKATSILHCVLVAIMIINGKRMIAEYLLPTICALGIYLLFIQKNRDGIGKNIIGNSLRLILPAAVGFGIYKLVCSTHNMNFGGNSNPSLNFNIGHLLENVSTTIWNLFTIFGYDEFRSVLFNGVAITVCVLVSFLFPLLQLIEFKKMTEQEKILFSFVVIHNAELLAVILLGDLLQVRYLLSSVFLLLIVSANFFYKKLTQLKHKWLQIVVTCVALLISLLYCRDLLKLTIDWTGKYEAQKDIAKQLLEHDISKGYASFWNGYPSEVYSDGKLTFGGVDVSEASFIKQYSNCDSSCYEHKDGKSCVMLSDSEVEYLLGAQGGTFINTFVGVPIDSFVIENPYLKELYGTDHFTVYIFEDDVCDRLTDGLKDGVLTPRELFFNWVGTRTEQYIDFELGGIIHGPYKKIAPGQYLVTYKGSNFSECQVDVVSEAAQDNIEYEVISQKDDSIQVDLKIANYIEDIQFYLYNQGLDTVRFEQIIIDGKQ